ncbi:MAG: precorrin-6y C5,15-methyltransferase (decarboxylating) subunit CbiE [Oscillospiraceae bacterium]|nr:precorrin-6y C5,15-methyltransferase (decarboxylating) subunit CbiE [Oscillospiraceae bacterium]
MKVYLIGTGADGRGTLTAEAAEKIAQAELLIGAKRMLAPYMDSGKELACLYHPERIAEVLRNSAADCAAVLLSGDSGFFSGAKNLLPHLSDMDAVMLPGISSMSAFCAKCGISYENMRFISLHGTSANIAVHAKMNRLCFFLLGGDMTAAAVCQQLTAYGLGEIRVHIGMNLGYENEQILHGRASDFFSLPNETLTVIITENADYWRFIPSAIPDSDFIRGKIPMTKAEIRCNAVAALNITHEAVVWDIGCGTGSVAVETAFRCPDGQVYAFDCKEEAVHLTEQNAIHFSCDNITAINGYCPDILRDYPAPDAVFIGGSGGELPGIFALIAEKNPKAVIALTAVSLETLAQAVPLFEQYCNAYQTVQIAVTRTKQIGSHTMFDAQNPVWLISGGFGCSAY